MFSLAAKKILIAENDIDTLFLISIFLSRHGYEVEGLMSGCELIDHRNPCCDLIILDSEMTVIDGIALCKYLKAHKTLKTVPVVIISGNHGNEKRALGAGAKYFIHKPIVPDELLKVVKDCFAEHDVQLGQLFQ
jgi:DNA-binding response OmpR family regulator